MILHVHKYRTCIRWNCEEEVSDSRAQVGQEAICSLLTYFILSFWEYIWSGILLPTKRILYGIKELVILWYQVFGRILESFLSHTKWSQYLYKIDEVRWSCKNYCQNAYYRMRLLNCCSWSASPHELIFPVGLRIPGCAAQPRLSLVIWSISFSKRGSQFRRKSQSSTFCKTIESYKTEIGLYMC